VKIWTRVQCLKKVQCLFFWLIAYTTLRFIQGVLIGSLCAMLLVSWLNIGRMSVNIAYPSLPLTSVDQCPAAVTNDTSPWQQSLWQQTNVTLFAVGCTNRQPVCYAAGIMAQYWTYVSEYSISISTIDFCWPMSCRCNQWYVTMATV